jgi:hypothetical protein
MAKTVGFRISRDLYDQIIAILPAYQGNTDIFEWVDTQYTDTVDHVANPPHEIIYYRVWPTNVAPGTPPVMNFIVNIFANRIF